MKAPTLFSLAPFSLLFFANLLFYPTSALAAAEPNKQNPDRKYTRKLNEDLQTAIKKHNLEEIGRLIDAGASPNGYVVLGSLLDFRSYPLCDALKDNDSESLAVVELLVKKGADLEFMGGNYNVLNGLLESRAEHKREKLSILLRNGIKINLVDVLDRLNRRYYVFCRIECDGKTPWQKERDDLEQLVRDELEKRARRQHLVSHLVQFFFPAVLANIVSEYRGSLGIKTAQDLQEEQQQSAEQQQLAEQPEQEQKESEQKEQEQQKSKQVRAQILV